MSTIAYKYPCCSAPLAFSGASGRLECASCGNSYEADALDAMYTVQPSGGIQFDLPKITFGAEDAIGMQGYICESCGAVNKGKFCPECGDVFDEEDVR